MDADAGIRPRRRKDGSTAYAVPYRHDGRQSSVTFDTLDAARRWRRLTRTIGVGQALDLLHAGTTPQVPALEDWFEHYLTHATGIHPGTAAEYRRLAARTWLPQLGPLPVDAITRDAVRRWVGTQANTITRRGTPTAAKTIANAHGLLSHVLSEAVDAGHRTDNPCRGVRLPQGEREEMTFLSEAEFARILDKIPTHWQPLIITLAGTGLRWGEATALQWRDLDLDAHIPTLRVARAWKRSAGGGKELGAPKTKRARRTISLPARVADTLRQLPRRGPDDYVFTSRQGAVVHHQNFHPRVWQPAVAASGVGKRVRIHDLRHSHASWLIASRRMSVLDIQHRLGHESAQTTLSVYGHTFPDGQAAAADVLDIALGPALPEIEGSGDPVEVEDGLREP